MKRELLIAVAMAAAALALFYALLFPKPSPTTAGAPPLSTERGPEGLAAAAQWLRDADIPVASLRGRFNALAAVGADRGNLLIASLPQRVPMRVGEQDQLLRWIARGNTLLLLAAIDDTPRWASGGSVDAATAAATLTHIEFAGDADTQSRAGSAEALADLLGPRISWIEPRGRHALMLGVQRLRDSSELPALHRHGVPSEEIGALPLAERVTPRAVPHDPVPHDAVLWVEPLGAGQILLSAFAAPFSNAQIDSADNARLLANIIAWSRGTGGRVIFDDAHQGLVDFYDPQAFFADARLHHSLEWIVLVWLVWVLGSQTLRSGQPLWQPTAATSLMEASARFFAARVPPASAAQRLLQNFYDEIHRRRGEPEDGSAPWAWLAAQPGLAPERVALLRELHERVQSRAGVSLGRLQTLLSQIRGSIR